MTLLVLCAALAGGVAAVGAQTDVVRRAELESVDLRFGVRGERPAPRDVVVVGIDDGTFDDPRLQWPFKRGLHARVIDALRRDGARVIGYDVQFTEPSPFPAEDDKLVAAVERAADRLVLATTEVAADGSTRVLGDGAAVEAIGARVGNTIMPADPNGVRRRMPAAYQGVKFFGRQMVEQGTRRPVPASRFGRRGALIDYHGPGGTLKLISFGDVLRGRFAPGTFRGRYVVVGATAPSLQDVAPTSMSGSELASGPEILAESVSTVLRGFPLRDGPGWLTVLLATLGSLLPGLATLRLSPARAFMAALAAGAVLAGASLVAFLGGTVIEVVVPLLALTVAAVASLASAAVLEAIERQRVRDAFARFVPEAVVGEVLDAAGGELRLGGTAREATVMFSDLRSFTSFSETREPGEVIDFLNDYLGEMSDAILDHGGTLVAFMGDGIMAVFGAPLDQADHRDRALAAAREMLERLARFNARRGTDFRMGIGLNSGRVMSGNVGSARRLEYTAIGDTTNTAARIEGMTKGTAYQLLLADSTYGGLTRPAHDLEFVAELPVRGREQAVRLWGLPDHPDPVAAVRRAATRESGMAPGRTEVPSHGG